ncbi:hypothetical protein CapIbe_009775, partial [Capra ibex]
MVNLGLSRVDDAVASKHPVRRPAWTRAPTSEADLSGAGALMGSNLIREAKRDRGTRRVRRVPVERFREGRFRLCHRHRRDLRPADAGSEEASIPVSVEGAAGCGRRLSSQLLGDACGVAEMQRPLALPGDRAAPQRHGHRSAQL